MGWRGSCLSLGMVHGAVRHYCLGGCSALVVCARRSWPVRGGWGRCRMLCLPRFPLLSPRFGRCVSRGVLSGSPLCSLSGTQSNAVCALCGRGPVALLVFSACPLCVCALALWRRPRPSSPSRGWCVARSLCWVLVGPFHAVRAPPPSPASVRCSVWLALGGSDLVPFLPTWLGAARSLWGGCGLGGPSPTPPRALLRAGFARCGGGTRPPGGGASSLGVGRPGLGALPPPTTRPFGRAARAHCPLAVGAGGAGVGTRHQSHSARSCELALRAVGAARGRPGGGRLLPGCGASGVGRSPDPDHSSFWACGRDPLSTGCGCGGCGREAPSPTPQRALLRAGLAHCGGGMRVPWGGRLLPGCGTSGEGHSPIPDLLSFRACGRGPLPTGCGCRVCGRGDPLPTPQHALLRAGVARCGGGMRAPGGGRLLPGCGASGAGRSPNPDLSSLRAHGRGPLPTGRGCGVRAWGPGCPWHLLPCRGSSCVVRASRVQGIRWPLWPGTCPCAVVVSGGVPLWRAPWPRVGAPRLVRSGRSRRSGRLFMSPWCLHPPWGLSPPALLGGCAGHLEASREPGSLCLPLAPAEARALGALRVVPASSLQLWSLAACAAVVWRVWTR